MLDFLDGIIAEAFTSSLPHILRFIGTSLKWCFYLGRRKFKDILDESWNGRLGFAFIALLFHLLVILPNKN